MVQTFLFNLARNFFWFIFKLRGGLCELAY
jgi:hypothetical protein